MERGQIIETGKHAELLARDGHYRHLYELQFADEEEPSNQFSVFSLQQED
jgi:subfamily B ATP-binding cassette protein MsbA